MRRKDWADETSEEVFDMVRNAEDDEDIIKRIAEELRKAFLKGLSQVQNHIAVELKHGSLTRYHVTSDRLQSIGMKKARSEEVHLNLDDAEEDKIMFTWDGEPSTKPKEDKRVKK